VHQHGSQVRALANHARQLGGIDDNDVGSLVSHHAAGWCLDARVGQNASHISAAPLHHDAGARTVVHPNRQVTVQHDVQACDRPSIGVRISPG
jgi:hypothetical protein